MGCDAGYQRTCLNLLLLIHHAAGQAGRAGSEQHERLLGSCPCTTTRPLTHVPHPPVLLLHMPQALSSPNACWAATLAPSPRR